MAVKRNTRSRKFTFKMKKKLLYIFLTVAAALFGLGGILIHIYRTSGEKYRKQVLDNMTYDSATIAARRGDITDRNGTILAYSTKVYNVIVDAKVLLSESSYYEPTIEALAKYFEIDRDKLETYIKENPKNSYYRLLKTLPEDKLTGFKEEMKKNSNIKGVWFEDEYQREYPFGSLAADLLGFSSSANGGELGMEKYYNDYLEGIDGRKYGYIDNESLETTVKAAVNGNTVVSTIDANIQNIVEGAIADFNKEHGSKNTAVIVMDPNNGEILSMASAPTFDLNNPRDLTPFYTDEEIKAMDDEKYMNALSEIWSNYCLSTVYEPGSVFKTFTISSILDENLIDPNKQFECDGKGIYNNSTILCHGGQGHGLLTMKGALEESCNDCLMQFSQIEGKENFSQYIRRFRFGSKTGIDLPGEEAGILIDPATMMDVDLATNAFGQNLNVTMVQSISAFASVINGGNYYQPHVVKEIKNSSGDTVNNIQPKKICQTVSASTSDTMRDYLEGVVKEGTGSLVYIDGYSIGGKTGAAEKQPRDKQKYIISFMGFAPVEDPEVLIYVVIDEPDVEDFDTSYAAQQLSYNIFLKLLPYLGIYPDDESKEIQIFNEEQTTGATDTPAADIPAADNQGNGNAGDTPPEQ